LLPQAFIFVLPQKRSTRKAFSSSRLLLLLPLRFYKTQIRTGDLLAHSELPALIKVLFQLRTKTKRGRSTAVAPATSQLGLGRWAGKRVMAALKNYWCLRRYDEFQEF